MSHDEIDDRDATSLLMLGAFFAAMGVLVLVATYWTVGRFHAMVVNVCAGTLLSLIGIGMYSLGRRQRAAARDHGRSN
ncbi:MAG: hypothetical protein K1X74_09575 [Pirellulales bacterium]|nr:hypothetical protein [Pirellulales bacterium]